MALTAPAEGGRSHIIKQEVTSFSECRETHALGTLVEMVAFDIKNGDWQVLGWKRHSLFCHRAWESLFSDGIASAEHKESLLFLFLPNFRSLVLFIGKLI